jgi:excisionase family DNA binding protein
VVGILQAGSAGAVQLSQRFVSNRREFTSPVLPQQKGVGRLRASDAGDELMTVKELAAELKVSTATVYKLVESGALAHVRILNAVRVRRRDFREYLARRTSK